MAGTHRRGSPPRTARASPINGNDRCRPPASVVDENGHLVPGDEGIRRCQPEDYRPGRDQSREEPLVVLAPADPGDPEDRESAGEPAEVLIVLADYEDLAWLVAKVSANVKWLAFEQLRKPGSPLRDLVPGGGYLHGFETTITL